MFNFKSSKQKVNHLETINKWLDEQYTALVNKISARGLETPKAEYTMKVSPEQLDMLKDFHVYCSGLHSEGSWETECIYSFNGFDWFKIELVEPRRIFTKDDLKEAFLAGKHIEEYEANSGINCFEAWFENTPKPSEEFNYNGLNRPFMTLVKNKD